MLTWLHQARRGHEEGRVAHAPGRGDDLASAAVDGLRRDGGVEDLELDVPDRLVAQGTFSHSPLEALRGSACRAVPMNTEQGRKNRYF